ncbi:MAG: UDP-N-acetylmuramoyl-tripeptide--D-alanyl-D-alanine ligase [Clostridiaceae bacterium]|nr:UDP-N-acetylmuramoyl-tripeptide--D-alanyl-D-alanine ligase [Clostridiaceae bacterium]
MGRFLPSQMKQWTGGTMVREPRHEEDTDRFYSGISKDTRTLQVGEAYVALRGDHFDGHRFLAEAVKKGAGLLVVEKDEPLVKKWIRDVESGDVGGPDLLLVDDTWKAYQDLAAGYRKMLSCSVVAVTGSVGKTTTRNMICNMVRSQLISEQSEGNLNNEIGLSDTLLSTDPDTQVLVTEVAMDRPGEIEQLSNIARPDISIITNIGFSHAEYLGTMRNILEEKTSIIKGMKENGLLLLNGDDPLLEEWYLRELPSVPVWFVASKENVSRLEREGSPVFWWEDLVIDKNGTSFIACSNLAPDEQWEISLPVAGEHYVNTSLFGLAVAYALGLDMNEAAGSAVKFTNIGSRQKQMDLGTITVMDDAYNASPESFASALETVDIMAEERRRILVLGGMRELGRYTKGVHETAARQILAYNFDRIILIGKETEYTKKKLLQTAEGRNLFAGWYTTVDDAMPRILQEVEGGDFVLLKASRYYHLERVTKALQNKFLPAEARTE